MNKPMAKDKIYYTRRIKYSDSQLFAVGCHDGGDMPYPSSILKTEPHKYVSLLAEFHPQLNLLHVLVLSLSLSFRIIKPRNLESHCNTFPVPFSCSTKWLCPACIRDHTPRHWHCRVDIGEDNGRRRRMVGIGSCLAIGHPPTQLLLDSQV